MQTEPTFRKVITCVSRVHKRLAESMEPMGEWCMCSWMKPTRRDFFQPMSMRMPTSSSLFLLTVTRLFLKLVKKAASYLDPKRGTFSNAFWSTWFASASTTIFDGSDLSTITFLGPCLQFPSTTHYTVIASDGHVHEYADRPEAIRGFDALPPQEVHHGSSVQTVVFPQFCYYHEVTCPSGVYRLEFFGPRMDEQGYQVKEAA